MRCKKHLGDLSSAVGVCATCLRDRLFALMEAQAQAQLRRDCRKSENRQPLPLSFPRSVSPYISRRKTAADWNHRSLYSTPQIGPIASLPVGVKKTKSYGGGSRFSAMVFGLFRSKSDKHMDSTTVSVESCSSSSWWFSNMIPGRRKKQIRSFSVDESSIGAQRRERRNRERGMSPARCSDEEDEHCRGGSSGYSSESSQGWRQTPQRTPVAARRGGGKVAGLSRNVSGLAFCLSPLVRASPNRQWNQKGIPPEALIAGESRIPAKPHLLFCKNRSRKLADFGRFNSRH